MEDTVTDRRDTVQPTNQPPLQKLGFFDPGQMRRSCSGITRRMCQSISAVTSVTCHMCHNCHMCHTCHRLRTTSCWGMAGWLVCGISVEELRDVWQRVLPPPRSVTTGDCLVMERPSRYPHIQHLPPHPTRYHLIHKPKACKWQRH